MLTVIVPVYNEAKTIDTLLTRVRDAPYPDKQVIVVDDGSTDGTEELLRKWQNEPGFVVLRHPANRGKGAAIRTALPHIRRDIVIIQDADLEYDPGDYPKLVEVIRSGRTDVVYGSRYLGRRKESRWSIFRLGVVAVNSMVWLLYGRHLTDEATCYKALRTELLRRLNLQSERFEFCAEVTAKLCRLRVPILEVPISYAPRRWDEGKKIGLWDFWQTILTLLRWRFARTV